MSAVKTLSCSSIQILSLRSLKGSSCAAYSADANIWAATFYGHTRLFHAAGRASSPNRHLDLTVSKDAVGHAGIQLDILVVCIPAELLHRKKATNSVSVAAIMTGRSSNDWY